MQHPCDADKIPDVTADTGFNRAERRGKMP
jgi:hypothetical protein